MVFCALLMRPAKGADAGYYSRPLLQQERKWVSLSFRCPCGPEKQRTSVIALVRCGSRKEKWVSLSFVVVVFQTLPPIIPEQEVTTENDLDTLAA